ncbi:DNA replication complex GINS protein SLD5 [Reticulomyxa filosa]|uniref:DNA replication complex GINS protein SLD5 n=1 Tax=Reticulomyxa filosa TaxID=46433 RepID=X6PD55_RETFI|nr:DNA replication complex GINS protein SLD5 [Reticulomyxa filosa]|eukprot:ETO35989.1 DNA replication complex GINS protein SLD5 [Reticulomyxa filosa]
MTSLILHLYEMEMERIKYILHSYLRARIWKIQQYSRFILSNQDEIEKLSQHELMFAKKYLDLNDKHLGHLFVDRLPAKLQNLSDEKMINKPILHKHVIMRLSESVGTYLLDHPSQQIELNEGDILVCRYLPFRKLLDVGTIDLL